MGENRALEPHPEGASAECKDFESATRELSFEVGRPFGEICHAALICEISGPEALGLMFFAEGQVVGEALPGLR
jgi:hypothetical protein